MAKAKTTGEVTKSRKPATSTKLKPGGSPEAGYIRDTKVKAAKESKPSQTRAGKKEFPEEPVILVTNDDGVTAPGIAALVDAVKHLGKVVVVAPDKAQSGMGHAITIGSPLRMTQVYNFGDLQAYSCNGTP